MIRRTAPAPNNSIRPLDNRPILLIEYKVNGFGTELEMMKLQALYKYIGPILERSGLGESEGYRSGGNTMEVCCLVNNFAKAKSFIAKTLTNSPYSGYNRIVEENVRYWKEFAKGSPMSFGHISH